MARNTLNKTRLRERLSSEGRWNDFVRVRESLKRDGVAPDQAWLRAADQFPPIAAESSPPAADAQPPSGPACLAALGTGDGAPGLPGAPLSQAEASSLASIVRDMLWAYDNAENPYAVPRTGGEATQLKDIRADRRTFLDRLSRLAPKTQAAQEAGEDTVKPLVELIDRVRKATPHAVKESASA